MADPYIDPEETQPYGLFAREQMTAVCLGMVPALDGAIQYCIAEQKKADVAMKAALDAHPAKPPTAADEAAVGEARDAIVRFGNYLGSIKGKPVELSVFFGRDVPSVFARRRMVKLVAALKSFSEKIDEQKANLRDHKAWRAEFDDLHTRVQAFEKKQRSARVDSADLGPEVADARVAWLGVYTANKAVITGILRHAQKLQLLPLVFDDLAEVHRAPGVSDAEPPPVQSSPSQPPPATVPTVKTVETT